MDNKNGMTRREALKRMGTVAMSAVLLPADLLPSVN